jgi:hypothetical protein
MKENYHLCPLKNNLWRKYKRLVQRPQISVSVYHKATVMFHGPNLTHKLAHFRVQPCLKSN